ncbi:tripartite motif-containing protein 60 [Tupaia chinensis]|uniref:Tripartite motif-containing protein 75 n=1 Tax=Tupaia chinensis TaxID=246437 RepID=L9JRA1_TUPCH|nr:tripartite motif-containing protein 60 [Tupaia chinensis]ELW52794.1 Tripartite motif-containing protein 75 [Tupaia chinensis]
MAAAPDLAGLQEETQCPICLDYLVDPVTIDCGHNFCSCCLQQACQDGLRCPVCRQPCRDGPFRSNAQLGRMVALARLLKVKSIKRKRQEELPECEQHGQPQVLFCEDERVLLCAPCAGAADHWGHCVQPVPEADAQHRKMLRSYLESLKGRMEDAQKLLDAQHRQLSEQSENTENQRRKTCLDFKHQQQFMSREQQAALSRLAEEERKLQQQLQAHTSALIEHIHTVQGLQGEVAERSVMSDWQVLAGLKAIVGRCESLQLPQCSSSRLKKEACSLPLQYSALQRVMGRYREQVTLDPATAHPNLLVSEDQKCVTYVRKQLSVPQSPQRFVLSPVVLGSQGFDSGRHYWEVQVEDKPEWAVGICRESLSRKGKGQSGCWALQLWDGAYMATGPAPVLVVLKEKPRRIGIYLDYELGEISFYNLNDMSHIHSFADRFSEVLVPYFCLGSDKKPLRICAVADLEG